MSLDVRFLAQTGSWIENLLKINESVKVSQLLLIVDNDRQVQFDFKRNALGVITCRSGSLNGTSDISIIGAGVTTELKKGETACVSKKFSTKIVSVIFPDERGRYTGKTYNYFLHEELPLPNLSDRIQIKSIKGFGDVVPQKPNYENKSVLVVGAFNVTADSVEEYADKILTYGDCLKTIYDYEVTSSIISYTGSQEKKGTLSIQVDDHEKLWQDLNNVVANTPYGFRLSDVNNEQVKIDCEGLHFYTKNDFGGWDLRAELKPYGKEDLVRNKYDDEWDSLVSAGAVPTYNTVEEMDIPKEETVSFAKKKERKSMKNIFGNIMKNVKFGQLNTDKVAYSMQGMAFKSSDGDYLVYKKDQPAVNVNEFVIEMPLFVMPVPLKDLQVGDIICKGEDFVLVDSIGETYITAINTDKSEIVTIVPQVNMFGFSFYSKVVAPTNLFGEATQDNPFGNILPLMMMNDEDSDSSVFGMMMLMSQMNGGKGMNMDFTKMAPLFLLDKQNGKDDTFKMMALMSMMNNGTEKKE